MTNPMFATPGQSAQTTEHHQFPLPPETRLFRPSYDQYGRYSLPDPEGNGSTKGFTRVTTGAKTLEDTSGLEKWKIRSIMRGLKTRPDLLEDVDLYGEPWDVEKALLEAAERAHVVAGGAKASEFGTAIHAWLEALELGAVTWDQVPDQFKPYAEVYGEALVKWGMSAAVDPSGRPYVERIVYNPLSGWVGTFDRIYQLADGSRAMGDVKTAKASSIKFSWLAISIQLDDYAEAPLMLSLDGTEWETMPEVRKDYAVVAHVPSDAEPPRCEMITVDLACGRVAMDAAVQVREMRTQAKTLIPNSHPLPRPQAPEAQDAGLTSLRTLVASCTTAEELAQCYEAYSHAWTDELTELGNKILARRGAA